MPKASRVRHRGHLPSAKPTHKDVADSESQMNVDFSAPPRDFSTTDVEVPEQEQPEPKKQTKKAKEIERREAFLKKLETGQRLFSKSHERRMKRKEREQLAGGMDQLQAALESAIQAEDVTETTIAEAERSEKEPKEKNTSKAGLIGKNGASTLSKNQRKRALELERLRHPFILKNPDFSANPFQTIRTHAKNTLVKHKAEAS